MMDNLVKVIGLEHAKAPYMQRQLSRPSVNLAAIARELGFADPYAFSRLFKRHSGLPPSRFAAVHRQARR